MSEQERGITVSGFNLQDRTICPQCGSEHKQWRGDNALCSIYYCQNCGELYDVRRVMEDELHPDYDYSDPDEQ